MHIVSIIFEETVVLSCLPMFDSEVASQCFLIRIKLSEVSRSDDQHNATPYDLQFRLRR